MNKGCSAYESLMELKALSRARSGKVLLLQMVGKKAISGDRTVILEGWDR